MKLLTLNFLTCAVKACKSSSASFPLHPKECELVSDTIAPNPKLIYNILPRIDWNALVVTASEVCAFLPLSPPPFFPSTLIVDANGCLRIVRIPIPPPCGADTRRARERREDDERAAYTATRDECQRGDAGVWELWA